MLHLKVLFTDGSHEIIDATPDGLIYYMAITKDIELITVRF